MLAICRTRLADAGLGERCRFLEGYIDELDDGIAYDAATSFLASHFITDRAARRAYFAETAARLRPGALLVNADLAGDRDDATFAELEQAWLAMIRASVTDAAQLEAYRKTFSLSVDLLPPDALADLIASAGFNAPVRVHQTGLIHGHFARRA